MLACDIFRQSCWHFEHRDNASFLGSPHGLPFSKCPVRIARKKQKKYRQTSQKENRKQEKRRPEATEATKETGVTG
jgi:hypothetical protein